MSSTVRVGAVQAEPEWLDLERSVEKTISLIQEAGQQDINILGFPEVWIPGYPVAIWTESVISNAKMLQTYRGNSLRRDSPEMDRICEAVKDAKLYAVLGYSERSPDGKSCYIAQSYISPQGVIVNHRRKAKPTGVERNLWGDGGTEALSTVIDTPFGRLGALCCAEHIMPLLRFHEYTQGVQIHVASWPMTFETHRLEEPIEGHEDYIVDLHASRFMAREGCCFVLVATQVLSEKSFENCGIREGKEFVRKVVDGGGHSMIYDPWGKPLAKSLAKEGEGILHADINIEDTTSPATMVDIVGHSARPDLLSLLVGNPPAITTRME